MDKQKRFYSNRIRTARKEQLDAQRKEFLNLANAEPNLGYPESIGDPALQPFPELDHVLVAREDGTKTWSQRPEGLKIDGDLSQILNKHRFDEGYVPTIEDMEFGEILIGAYDAKLFIKRLVDGVESIAEIETGIQGPQGTQGTQGIQGERQPFIPVQIVGNVPDVNATLDPQQLLDDAFPNPELGDGVFDLATSDLWVWVGSEWLNVGLLRGPEGPQGIQGPQGVQGNPGIQGSLGIQGPRGFTGIQGPQGLQGLQGIQGQIGRSLRLLGTVETVTDIPQYPSAAPGTEVGDAYVALDDGNIYIWNGIEWFNGGRILIQGTQGPQGTQGVQGSQGVQGFALDIIDTYNDPDVPLTSEFLNDTYPLANPYSGVVDISSGSGVLWQKGEDGEWEEIGTVSVQGPQGTQGIQGLQGPQSTQGMQGFQGIQGIPGLATRLIGTYNDPTEPLTSELLNDLFPSAIYLDAVIDITSGNGVLWLKQEDGTWLEIGIVTIQGVQGPQGTQGVQGTQGLVGPEYELFIGPEPPPSPKIGDAWLDSTTGIKYIWIDDGNSLQWVETYAAIQGPQGTQGLQGLQGLQGSTVPFTYSDEPPLDPDIGDIWFDSTSGIKYQWVYDNDSFQWVETYAAIQGTQGTQGVQGVQGVQGTKGDSGGVTLDGANTTDAEFYVLFDDAASGLQNVLTTSPQFRYNPSTKALSIQGSFNAETKSFLIPHPTKPGMLLRHGSLEGPEFGVYVRGEGRGGVIALPEVWQALVDWDTITVQITPKSGGGSGGQISVKNIDKDTGVVVIDGAGGDDGYFYLVIAERADVPALRTELKSIEEV